MTLEAARLYSAQRGGLQFAAYQNGQLVINETQNGAPFIPQIIHSCTKSVAAAFALYRLIKDGRIPSLDTAVGNYVPTWAAAPLGQLAKRKTTFRQLLSLTSGLDPGPLLAEIPYAQAVTSGYGMPSWSVGHHRYGPSSYSVLGYVMHRLGIESPLVFIEAELASIGVSVANWRLIGGDYAQPRLDGYAHMFAEQLAKYGDWMRRTLPGDPLLEQFITNQCQHTDDPLYGIGFWLCGDFDSRANPFPPRVFAALGGAEAQRRIMLVVPQQNLSVACFVEDANWDDTQFVNRLLAV